MGSSPLCLGVHVSIAGKLSSAVERARELRCGTMQIFSRSPRGWKAAPLDPVQVERFRQDREEAKISPLAIHASYLINLATQDDSLFERSLSALEEELQRSDQLGADYLVVHVGSNACEGLKFGITRVVEALKRMKAISLQTRLLLENTAGERGDIGSKMEELAEILSRLENDPPVDLCLDTCHAFAVGYDISHPKGVEAWVRKIESTVGLNSVKLLHVNDSKKDLGCHVDRHEHIGRARLGLKASRPLPVTRGFKRSQWFWRPPKSKRGMTAAT